MYLKVTQEPQSYLFPTNHIVSSSRVCNFMFQPSGHSEQHAGALCDILP